MGRPTHPSGQQPATSLKGLQAIIDLVANLKETLITKNEYPYKELMIDFCDLKLPIAQELDTNAGAQDPSDVLKDVAKGMKDLANTQSPTTQGRNSAICNWYAEKHPTAERPSRTDPNKLKCGNCRDNHWRPMFDMSVKL